MKLIYSRGHTERFQVTQSKESFDNIKGLFNANTSELIEEMVAVYFDPAGYSIGWRRVSTGGIQGTVMDNRLIIAAALTCGATSLIVAHNHPSGNTHPSDQDLKHTYDLKLGARYLGLTLNDHLIIAGDLGSYCSLKDTGKI